MTDPPSILPKKSCDPLNPAITSPTPREALYYSNDTPYWQSILYSPLFILYWRRQIPPSILPENLVIPKILQPTPPLPTLKALYYSNDTPHWQSIFYSPLFILC